ncbi:ROK family protein [Agromyces silvae]|uniref:ROK family protein n=1 Tax=Agromyces silvae TaxID=3388266 RepID=UPI00280B319A|nr:ROK family protein [Agromyces protaetiae]
MSVSRAIGVDVGGTSIKAVLADAHGRVLELVRRETPSPDVLGDGVVDAVARILADVPDDDGLLPVGVVVPGIVDETRGMAVHSANLGWRDLPMAAMLEDRLGRPIGFGHDVRAGGLAEARWGAAADATGTIAFVPIGTGIAAAILIDGVPLVAGGWAGEIGQVRVSDVRFAGRRVEEVASAAGTARRAALADAEAVVRRVRDGDAAATAVWNDTVDVLADALAGMTATIAPTTIVIGGGLALAGAILFTPLVRALDERLGPLHRPNVVPAQLGDRAAALGAALIAKHPS